ncbi:4-hydroxythreonine-4-phosphate dehydrogenase PdxA [Xanthobacter sp. V0B-10]|uniref:4-hydroxythreonine-4-phosphate dehydrogenase PdxA n=1 Tax=Xanthobacter albus TaxID=3119929 RepID=UPI003727E760
MPQPAQRLLALTAGEPAGVGPELALMAWRARDRLPAFFVVGDEWLLAARSERLGLGVPVAACAPEEAAAVFENALPVVRAGPHVTAAPGRPDGTSAAAVRASLDTALDLVRGGGAAALVTNPLAKSVMYAAGFPFPGHTEYLAARAAEGAGPAPRAVMMIWSPLLAVVPATIHVPLRQVPDLVTVELLVDTGRIVAADLRRRFGLPMPRLAFAGLNPHAGEDGTLGREDEEVVRPAVARLVAEGIDARGPLPADTLFHPEARAGYDVVVGMYHDQVLIPAKTLAFHDGVNVTLGLPFIRTSPDHGTAFDIAGTGRANPASLMAALRLARRLADTEAHSCEAPPA